MPYLGQKPKDTFTASASQTITGTGATAYSLNQTVTSPEDIEVFINNVQQQPTVAYTVSGQTITFDEALLSTDSCYVVFRGARAESRTHPAASNLQAANITATTQTLNRSGDGDLIAFQKGGADSGSISIESSGTAFDGEAGHAGLKMFLGSVAARQNGADVDNIIDLGWTGGKFKDIYLGGNVVIGTAGKGIDFSVNANATNADTELLDDYESGTWTASFRSHSNGTETNPANHNTTTQDTAAEYVKVGRMVFISAWVDVSSLGGHIFYDCTGVPFASASGSGQVAMALPHLRGIRFGYSTSYIQDSMTIGAQMSRGGATSVQFTTSATNTPFSGYFHVLNIGGGKYIGFAGTYEAA